MTTDKEKEQKKKKKKTLSLSGKKLSLNKPVDGSGEQIRQSFSHGRSKTVQVEVKRKRSAAEDKKSHLTRPSGLTDSEWASRLEALKNAQENADAYAAEVERKKEEQEQLDAERRLREEKQRLLEEERLEKKKREEEEEARLKESALQQQELTKSNSDPEESSQASAPPKLDTIVKDAEGTKETPARKTREKSTDRDESHSRKTEPKVVEAKKTSSSAKRHKTRQKLHQISYEEALEEGDVPSYGSRKSSRPRKEQPVAKEAVAAVREVIIPEALTVQELANRMAVRAAAVVKSLMSMGVMATINQTIDAETAELVVVEFGQIPKKVSMADVEIGLGDVKEEEGDFVGRPPVVTVMGHVDHGKTSLLDAIRESDVASGEAGGITQHIGAYQVQVPSGDRVSFIDTPGHAAFTEMRSRGANVTDIVILVVAADDGIKEQTVEAIHHAKAAKVPIIVAVNKMDKPGADATRVRNELLQHDLVVEELGGDILSVEVSAKKKTNLDKLLEFVMLQSEILELKANPSRSAKGVIVESKVEVGRGSVGTVLVQQGTLKVGDIFVAGREWGRVRALVDHKGRRLEEALPSQPVEVQGFGGAPSPGDDFVVVENEARAREVAEFRLHQEKEAKAARMRKSSMDLLMGGAQEGDEKRSLALVVKSDVQGSVEAIVSSLEKVQTEEVGVSILHTGVGAINESDVSLANASNGLVIGFNVRATPQARELAGRDQVEIRYYSIIYDVLDDMKALMSGLLAPTLREKYIGSAEVQQVFNITKVGKIAGCLIKDGLVMRGAKVRLLRDSVVIHEGRLKTLKRFKDEVKEAREGYECGMAFENYQDIRDGDIIECFDVEEIQRTLD